MSSSCKPTLCFSSSCRCFLNRTLRLQTKPILRAIFTQLEMVIKTSRTKMMRKKRKQ